ncbi:MULTISPECIES: PAS domain S-box protein [unclassified Erythrobacter]|uniref:sensor histidine kinase n=1 Tax=unclassified Erythrobacter TaxID=2633097 RepID=UPI001F215441|nr:MULTISPECIES: PAS domain S-box protein [unclassified Erythrobacter]
MLLVGIPLAVLFGALGSLYLASSAEARAEDDVRRAFEIQRDTYQVHALLSEAAAAVRSYVLTRDRSLLAPYDKARQELPPIMESLDQAIEDAGVRSEFEALSALVEDKSASQARLVGLATANQPGPEGALIRAELAASSAVLDELGDRVDSMQRAEAELLERRRATVDNVRERYFALTAISALFGLLGSLAAVYLFSTGIVRRVRILENNAGLLARGERLLELPEEADEIGRLGEKLARASDLLRAREKDLSESEERFRLVIDRVRDYGIFALEPDGTVATWNLGAERIKGWRAEEILGRHFSTFYPQETRDRLPAIMLQKARKEGAAEDEGWRMRKDGSRFWANVVITALRDADGTLRGFAKVTRDMSERRRTEEALLAAREEAIAADQAKTAFLSRTSHELRTPMNAILGFGQLLEMEEDSFADHHRSAVQQIMKAGRHLLSVINDLLDISSIEAGAEDLQLEPVNLNDLLREAHSMGAPLVRAADLQFQIEAADNRIEMMVDKRRTLQVCLNLIANAAKYNLNGEFVRLSGRMDKDLVRIEIADDGPGIATKDIPRLFTAFDRLGQNERSTVEGTGLGLALSKSLVGSMGGTIGYDRERFGSIFWFALPAMGNAQEASESHDKGTLTEDD